MYHINTIANLIIIAILVSLVSSGCNTRQNHAYSCKVDNKDKEYPATEIMTVPYFPNYSKAEFPRFRSLYDEHHDPFFAWCAVDRCNWFGIVLLCIYEDGTIVWNSILENKGQDQYITRDLKNFYYISNIHKRDIECFINAIAEKQSWRFNTKSPLVPNESPAYSFFFRVKNTTSSTYLWSNITPFFSTLRFYGLDNDFLDEWKYLTQKSLNLIPEKKNKLNNSDFIFICETAIVQEPLCEDENLRLSDKLE
jgi:hypothetical protein